MLRYAITDRHSFGGSESEMRAVLLEQCTRLARDGVDFLQLREKDLPVPALAEVSQLVLKAVRFGGKRTKLLINTRVDVSLLVGAAGVHISAAPANIPQIRHDFLEAARPEPVISLSCHTLDDIRAAIPFRPCLILFAPVFGKTLAGRSVTGAAGLDTLAQACRLAAPIPVLALGGVTAENTLDCLQAGASGVAGIRLFLHERAG